MIDSIQVQLFVNIESYINEYSHYLMHVNNE